MLDIKTMKINIKIIQFLFFYLLLVGCSSTQIETPIPSCIQKKIIEIQNNPIQNPPAKVQKWEVNGAIYYYITSNCCDQYNYLYDEGCTIICAPDGGITGFGDGKCFDFSNLKKTLIWEDNRK